MYQGRTVLAQILDGLEVKEFSRCAIRYPMPRDTPTLSAYDHFATMVFAQLTYRESLRDIEVCLGSRRRLLYHSGIRGTVKRCNLAYANEHRAAQMFAEVPESVLNKWEERFRSAIAEWPVNIPAAFPRDLKDAKFLACALATEADFLDHRRPGF